MGKKRHIAEETISKLREVEFSGDRIDRQLHDKYLMDALTAKLGRSVANTLYTVAYDRASEHNLQRRARPRAAAGLAPRADCLQAHLAAKRCGMPVPGKPPI